jgi:hypothetical protein
MIREQPIILELNATALTLQLLRDATAENCSSALCMTVR